jgi:hypothetical protein
VWIGFLKPTLLLAEGVERFVYLDADIVVADGAFFNSLDALTAEGPALALEGIVGPADHRRVRWSARLGTSGLRTHALAYYNGGFLAGRLSRDKPLLLAWAKASRHVLAGVGGYFMDADFPLGDQDALNAVLQHWEHPLVSLQFPDWWSAAAPLNPFLHVGGLRETAFFHCTGSKPWKLKVVPPRPPTAYELRWYRHAVLQPSQVRVTCDLPVWVHRWLANSAAGRLASRGKRWRERLSI